MNKLALSLAAAAVFAFSAGAASAQTYPERAITIIVPFAAGGPTDTVTRLVAEAMSADLGAQVERRINEEIERAHEIVVDFLPRNVADADPALIRTAANLIPAVIDPLRIIDIIGLDRQADGGTHVLSTAEVGRVNVTGTESKGKDNKRIRLEVVDA